MPPSLKRDTGLYRAFGGFYEGLYRWADSGRFDLLRNAFTEYVARHWSGGQVKEISKRAVMTGADGWKYVSKDEAKRQLEIDLLWVNRYIESGRLKALVLKSGSLRKFLVEVSSLEKLKRELVRGLDTTQAMARIGVNKNSLRQLVRVGLLEAVRGPAADGLGNWRYSQDAIDALLENMKRGMTHSASALVGDEISFHQALRRVCGLGVKIGDFIKAVLDGVVVPCGVTPAAGVSRFMFDEASVARFGQSVKSAREGRHSSPAAAADT